MPALSRLVGLRRPQALPPDIYASHVEALFSDARSLLIGVTAACLTTLVTGLQTRQIPILVIAAALALLGGLRLRSMRTFTERKAGLDTAGLQRWETWYIAGGAAHVGLLGLFCLASFLLTADPFAHLASVSITMAYLVGTPGRSFANDLLVNAQILAAGVPMLIALIVAGADYWFVIAFVMLPFFLALKTISTRLRGIFVSAVLRARDLSAMAKRFDTAINNMPQGLAMFDADGAISVSNGRLVELLRLPPEWDRHGSLDHLLERCGRDDPFGGAREGEWVHEMTDGRSIAFKVQAMANGGGVILADDVTERMRAQASISYLARFDALTALPNRHHFSEQVRKTLQSDRVRRHALMFIDLDRFKQVNDTLGHATGDKLLQAVSDRLRPLAYGDGVVARFGGDEFVLFQSFGELREEAAQLAMLVIRLMSEPFDILGNPMVIGVSVGIAVAPETGGSVEDLLRDADLALYRAKADGRRTFRFFQGEMQVQAQTRRDIEKDLREALAQNALQLHYQPIFDLTCGKFLVCEALLRWHHPERGPIPPSEFIPIAEEIGLIADIGEWVLKQASRECANWPDDIRVAVNVSAMQFRDGSIVASAKQAVAEAGIRPERLEIEITETALLQDLPATRAILLQLRHAGIRVSLDDFGTGFSSLSYLQLLPLNKIKLDRSFLQGLTADSRGLALLRGIARMSAELGMAVVMEGVETADQLALVVEGAGITEIQGYFYSRPLPADRVRPLLRAQRRTAA